MTKFTPKKLWRVGDLVLLETGPKVHARLMEIIEVNGAQARLAPLDLTKAADDPKYRREHAVWSPVELLVDPALYIKTEEFLETLRAQLARKDAPPTP